MILWYRHYPPFIWKKKKNVLNCFLMYVFFCVFCDYFDMTTTEYKRLAQACCISPTSQCYSFLNKEQTIVLFPFGNTCKDKKWERNLTFFFFFFLPNRPLRSGEILGESISEVSFSHKENILVSSNPSQSPPQSTKGPSSLGHPSGPGWAPWKVPQDWNLPHTQTHTQIVFSLSPWPLWDPDDLPVDVKVNQSKGRCLGGLHPGGWRSNHRVPHKSHKGNISIPESVRHQ